MWCEQLPELPQPGQQHPAPEDSVPASPAPASAGLQLQGEAAVAPGLEAVAAAGGPRLLLHPRGAETRGPRPDQARLLQHGQEVPPRHQPAAGRQTGVRAHSGGLRCPQVYRDVNEPSRSLIVPGEGPYSSY